MTRRKWALSALAVAAGLLALVVALDVGTASPALCSSCHEIGSRAHAWSRSAHQTVPCVKCHLPVRPWYAVPQRLGDRVALLRRDVSVHFEGGFVTPVENRAPGKPPIADETCLQCHDPNRKATSGFRIKIEHAEHAKRNGSCVSCHVRTAHPIPTRGKAMSLMTQCFTCHGLQASAKAPGQCSVCHPSGYTLRPGSHKPKTWRKEHGEVARSDPKQCGMCHSKSFCSDCHGLDMPHPTTWARAGRLSHGKVAAVNRALCDNCHTGGRDMCTMCHHSGFVPKQGPWVKQHFKQVRAQGLGECMDCHSPVFCSGCHVRGAMASSGAL